MRKIRLEGLPAAPVDINNYNINYENIDNGGIYSYLEVRKYVKHIKILVFKTKTKIIIYTPAAPEMNSTTSADKLLTCHRGPD